MKNLALENYLKSSAGVEKASGWLDKDYPVDTDKAQAFKKAVEDSDIIVIVGDYDCDGICSSHILKQGITRLYPDKTVSVILPDRFRDGYGIKTSHIDMTARVLDQMRARGRGFLHPCIMTCDNGSSSMDVFRYAKEKIPELTVVVTDHHIMPEGTDISPADVFCNPHYGGFSYDQYCGAGCAYKLIESLAEGSPKKEALLRGLIQYAGIATVADCMELKEDNWALVRRSLDVIKEDLAGHKTPAALKNLFEAMGIEHPSQIDADFFGYKLGPLMNAMGRLLDHGAARMLKYLENPTLDESSFILETNQKRRALIDLTLDQLFDVIKSSGKDKDPVIFAVLEPPVYGEAAAEGLCGLFAGKIAEHFHKPAIVAAPGRIDPGCYKGSARNVPGFDIYSFIRDAMSAPGYLCGFGGHKEACGITITKEKLAELVEELDANLSQVDVSPYLYDDPAGTPGIFESSIADMAADYKEIQADWAPFGNGFPAPLYSVEMDASRTEFNTMGEGKHFWAKDGNIKFIHFHHDESTLSNPDRFYMLGGLCENYWDGRTSLQFIAKEVCQEDPLSMERGLQEEEEILTEPEI